VLPSASASHAPPRLSASEDVTFALWLCATNGGRSMSGVPSDGQTGTVAAPLV
jgi:hypothetical protein